MCQASRPQTRKRLARTMPRPYSGAERQQEDADEQRPLVDA